LLILFCFCTFSDLGIIKSSFVRFEIFTAVTMKNGVFWDVTLCGSCKNRRFGRTYRLHNRGDKNRWTRKNVSLTSNRRKLLRYISSETSFLSRATRRNIPRDGILNSILTALYSLTCTYGNKAERNQFLEMLAVKIAEIMAEFCSWYYL
jgi:hypothetical protein